MPQCAALSMTTMLLSADLYHYRVTNALRADSFSLCLMALPKVNPEQIAPRNIFPCRKDPSGQDKLS